MESRSLSGFNTPSDAGSRVMSPQGSFSDKRDTSKMFLPPPAESHSYPSPKTETRAPSKTKDPSEGASSNRSNREGQLPRRGSIASDSPARRGSVASEKASGGEGQLSQGGTLSRQVRIHPGGNPGANLKSISHRCHPMMVACVWELTEETIDLPLGCLQGGLLITRPA